VYCGLYRGDLYSTLGWRALWRGETGELAQCILATTYSGTRWFGHFLHDELPLQELVSSLGAGVGHLRPSHKHEPGWRAALGVKAPPSYASLRVRELVLIDDCGQNPAKRSRYRKLRSRVSGFPRGHDRIFLRRSRSPGSEDRHIVNSDEVEERLVQEGFHVVDTGHITVDEMLKRCMGASIIVSVDGSHATPSFYFGGRGACLLFIYPPKRVSVLLPRLAQFYGMIGAMFIGEPVSRSDSEFRVDPDELMREIDACARARNMASPNLGPIWSALDCREDHGGPCRADVDAKIEV
jgi:Glycosyltransferase 61